MSTLKLSPTQRAAGAAKKNGTRRQTAKKQPRSGSSHRQAAARITKKAAIEKLLRRKQGATIKALRETTGWKPHSVRAALTGLRKTGVEIRRVANAKGETVYRAVGS